MPRLAIRQLPLGAIGTNCYVVNVEGSAAAFVVDPGDQADVVLDLAREEQLEIEGVLVTHCHWDHIGGVAPIAREAAAPVWMSSIEAFVLEQDPNRFVPAGVGPFEPCEVQHKLDGGERFEVAGIEIEALHLPGHSPGSIGFLVAGEREGDGDEAPWATPPILFVGDLIFQGSVGRTDLPGSDPAALMDSARLVFERCHGDTVLLSGHGAATTVAAEQRTNPFLRELATS